MKAVVLAGGEGTRLRPLTCNLPKPMVPILNRPFLERLLLRLKEQEVEEVALTLSYLPEVVKAFFGEGEALGLQLSYPVEEQPLGTAGAVKNWEQRLDDTFLVFNGDIFTDLDLSEVVSFHRQKKAQATIVLTPVEDPTAYGVVEADASGRVRRFLEKPSQDQVSTVWVNAGTYVLEPQVLEHIPAGQPYMFERGLFPWLLEQGLPVYCYPSRAYWMDLGTPGNYLRLHRDLLLGAARLQLDGEVPEEGVWMGKGCRIAPDVQLRPPVVLGPGCTLESGAQVLGPAVVGPECTIGQGSVVDGAVLWSRVRLGAGTTVTRCILANEVVVGDGVTVGADCILADGAVVEQGNSLGKGVVLWPGKRLEEEAISRL